jgi:hypothetical protein
LSLEPPPPFPISLIPLPHRGLGLRGLAGGRGAFEPVSSIEVDRQLFPAGLAAGGGGGGIRVIRRPYGSTFDHGSLPT